MSNNSRGGSILSLQHPIYKQIITFFGLLLLAFLPMQTFLYLCVFQFLYFLFFPCFMLAFVIVLRRMLLFYISYLLLALLFGIGYLVQVMFILRVTALLQLSIYLFTTSSISEIVALIRERFSASWIETLCYFMIATIVSVDIFMKDFMLFLKPKQKRNIVLDKRIEMMVDILIHSLYRRDIVDRMTRFLMQTKPIKREIVSYPNLLLLIQLFSYVMVISV